jgi:hypothetical protein
MCSVFNQGRSDEKSYREKGRPQGSRPQAHGRRKEAGRQGAGQALSQRFLLISCA